MTIGQSTVDRPDLVAQVSCAKQQALLKKTHNGYFWMCDWLCVHH